MINKRICVVKLAIDLEMGINLSWFLLSLFPLFILNDFEIFVKHFLWHSRVIQFSVSERIIGNKCACYPKASGLETPPRRKWNV